MTRLAVRRFTDADREAASALPPPAAPQRRVEPGLDPAYEDPGVARALLDTLVDRHHAEGVAAERGGRVTAFLLGTSRDDAIWGPNAWVEPEGWAAEQAAEDVRDVYAAVAAAWLETGRTAHYAVVPATDPTLADAWFRLGFGYQHVHAIGKAPAASELAPPLPGLAIRRARRGDLDALARLDLVLPEQSDAFAGLLAAVTALARGGAARLGGELRRRAPRHVRRRAEPANPRLLDRLPGRGVVPARRSHEGAGRRAPRLRGRVPRRAGARRGPRALLRGARVVAPGRAGMVRHRLAHDEPARLASTAEARLPPDLLPAAPPHLTDAAQARARARRTTCPCGANGPSPSSMPVVTTSSMPPFSSCCTTCVFASAKVPTIR